MWVETRVDHLVDMPSSVLCGVQKTGPIAHDQLLVHIAGAPPEDVNDDQANADGDDHGDVCDNCVDDVNNDQSDGDSDTVGDVCDNCVGDANKNQANADGDFYGDACDNCVDDVNDDQSDKDDSWSSGAKSRPSTLDLVVATLQALSESSDNAILPVIGILMDASCGSLAA